MQTITIKDLTRTDDLDTAAMASVSGGMFKGGYYAPSFSFNKDSLKFSAEQTIGQNQLTEVNNGNNVAFASGITSNVKPTQKADNSINFFA